MTCMHGVLIGARCFSCDRMFAADEAINRDGVYPIQAANDDHWGYCDHGVTLAPAMDCPECETREDDYDA